MKQVLLNSQHYIDLIGSGTNTFGKEWPVMWFFVGFAVSVFVFNDNSSRKTKCVVS